MKLEKPAKLRVLRAVSSLNRACLEDDAAHHLRAAQDHIEQTLRLLNLQKRPAPEPKTLPDPLLVRAEGLVSK